MSSAGEVPEEAGVCSHSCTAPAPPGEWPVRGRASSLGQDPAALGQSLCISREESPDPGWAAMESGEQSGPWELGVGNMEG